MKGVVKNRYGTPKAYKYEILGEDGNTYIAHTGDLLLNEQIVYQSPNQQELNKDDQVEFKDFLNPSPRAINVNKI